MTANTLHAVSRILTCWEQAGPIESARQRIVLREPEILLAEQAPDEA
jgi:hypothetical protein